MNQCKNCYHKTDYNLKCPNCKSENSLLQEFNFERFKNECIESIGWDSENKWHYESSLEEIFESLEEKFDIKSKKCNCEMCRNY